MPERKMNNNKTFSHQSAVLNKLRLEGRLCDTVIRVDDVEFKIHKLILCCCSSWFRSLFENWCAPDQIIFEISGMSPHIMKTIIEFAYTGIVSVTPENVQDLLLAADQYNLMDIVQICCSFLEKELSPKNCIGIWKFTQSIETPELQAKAYRYISDHFEEVAIGEEFVELSVQELYELLKRDQLSVRKESNVFEAILRWIAHAPAKREKDFVLLFPNVRLALTSEDYITFNVMSNELVLRDSQSMEMAVCAREIIRGSPNRPGVSSFCDPPARPRVPTAILLATGGILRRRSPTCRIEAYDVRSDHWIKLKDNLQSPIGYHGTVFFNGDVYCLGGYDLLEYHNNLRRLDLHTHTWTELSPMHYRRSYVSTVVLNGYIYAIGGKERNRRLKTAERYNPDTNQWSLIAPMNERRSDSSCTTLHNKIYICGGFNGDVCLQTAEFYTPETNQWTMMPPMLSPRKGLGVTAYTGRIFAIGGLDGNNCLKSAEVYDPRTNTWQEVTSMRSPHSNFGIGVIEDKLFVAGGCDGNMNTSNVEFYDDSSDAWFEACDMQLRRSCLSCCVLSGLPNLSDFVHPRDILPLFELDVDDSQV